MSASSHIDIAPGAGTAPTIGREWLHDHTLQMLEYIAAGGYAETPDVEHLRDVAAAAADALRERLERGHDAPRALVSALADTVAHAQRLAGRTQIFLSMGTVARPVPAADVETIAAAVGEALTNVRKHADACHAFVRCTEVDGVLEVVVADDGRGFDIARCRARTGMRNSIAGRLIDAGGTVGFDSSQTGGTRVTLRLPLGAAPAGVLTTATEVAR